MSEEMVTLVDDTEFLTPRFGTVAKDWDESLHPRDAKGEFTESRGGESAYPLADVYRRGTGETSFRSPQIAKMYLSRHVNVGGSVLISDEAKSLAASVYLDRVLGTMQQRGYAMPDQIEVLTVDRETLKAQAAFARPLADDRPIGQRAATTSLSIQIPSAIPRITSLNEAAKVSFGGEMTSPWGAQIRMTSVQSFDDVIVHEMGHLQAGIRVGGTGKTMADLIGTPGPWNTSEGQSASWFTRAAQEVSSYADTNTDEFLAESFTRLYRGDTLPPNSQLLYDALDGPKVKR